VAGRRSLCCTQTRVEEQHVVNKEEGTHFQYRLLNNVRNEREGNGGGDRPPSQNAMSEQPITAGNAWPLTA